MKFRLILLFLLLQVYFVFCQQKKEPKTEFEVKFDTLLSTKSYDKILMILKKFEFKKKISSIENQIFYACKGKYFSEIRRKEDALISYQKSLQFVDDSKKSVEIKVDVYERIADINFTFLDFDQAKKYAKLAEPLIDKSNYFDYINIHSIIGYIYYIQNDLKKCSEEYNKVHALILEKKDYCKEPEILMKIAKLKDKLGYFKHAMDDIDICLKKAKECNIGVYLPGILSAKYDILKRNYKYKEAVEVSEKVAKTIDSLGFRKQNQKIYELQIEYDKNIKEKENRILKLLNIKEKELINKQKWVLVTLFLGLILLGLLLGFLYKLNKKQKKQNVIIEQNNLDLARLNLLNQKIFSVISHDFKSPITTLRLFLNSKDVLQTQNSDLKRYANEAVLQLDQSDAMLNSLLDWAKMELNVGAKNKVFNLTQVINQVVGQLKDKFELKNITLKNNVDSQTTINFSSEIAVIVIRNIMSNAIKFSFDNKSIEINFANNRLEIKDFGNGIALAKLNRLFKSDVEPGFGTQFETGFGIGLYLSNELMNKNGGSISVTNNENGGCSFYVNF